jgi:hypothetical protein
MQYEFVPSKISTPMIFYRLYVKKNTPNGKYWRCRNYKKFKCYAHFTLFDDGNFESFPTEHLYICKLVTKDEVNKLRCMDGSKKKAGSEPAIPVRAIFANGKSTMFSDGFKLTPKSSVYMPKYKNIYAICQRARAKNYPKTNINHTDQIQIEQYENYQKTADQR